jgi:hypothetical protein
VSVEDRVGKGVDRRHGAIGCWPLGSQPFKLSLCLQILHHGSTAVHYDVDGSRSLLVYLRLERSCATLTWSRPCWSGLRGGNASSSSSSCQPDFCLSVNAEEVVSPGMALKYATNSMGSMPLTVVGGAGVLGSVAVAFKEVAVAGLEEGYLDLDSVKDVILGADIKDRDPEVAIVARRYGLDKFSGLENSLAIIYGANLSDNRIFMILSPPHMCK